MCKTSPQTTPGTGTSTTHGQSSCRPPRITTSDRIQLRRPDRATSSSPPLAGPSDLFVTTPRPTGRPLRHGSDSPASHRDGQTHRTPQSAVATQPVQIPTGSHLGQRQETVDPRVTGTRSLGHSHQITKNSHDTGGTDSKTRVCGVSYRKTTFSGSSPEVCIALISIVSRPKGLPGATPTILTHLSSQGRARDRGGPCVVSGKPATRDLSTHRRGDVPQGYLTLGSTSLVRSTHYPDGDQVPESRAGVRTDRRPGTPLRRPGCGGPQHS